MEKGIFRGPGGAHAGPPKQEYVLRTALEIASALCYCHGQDILHGDLTGNNVLLVSSNRDPRGFVVKVGGVGGDGFVVMDMCWTAHTFPTQVTDFGLSRIVQESVIKTETFGTATHMPPELLTKGLCSKAVDVCGGVGLCVNACPPEPHDEQHPCCCLLHLVVCSQVYAFGVLLWEMWNGIRAWAGMHQLQVIFNTTVQNKRLEFDADANADYVVRGLVGWWWCINSESVLFVAVHRSTYPFVANTQALANACMDSEPENRPTFTEIVSRLNTMAGDLH